MKPFDRHIPVINPAETLNFRAAFEALLATPSAGEHEVAQGDIVQLAWLDTPVGLLLAGATDAAVCFLEFTERERLESQLARLRREVSATLAVAENALLRQMRQELAEYFAGTRREFTLPLSYRGTPFQERVWSALREIPYGKTISYQQLATQLGCRDAVRAVGGANGLNRIAIIVPCHRVVNSNGALGGYGGGLWRKQHLLHLERGDALL